MPAFTNQATLRYNDTVTNSNIVTGEVVGVISATKTAHSFIHNLISFLFSFYY